MSEAGMQALWRDERERALRAEERIRELESTLAKAREEIEKFENTATAYFRDAQRLGTELMVKDLALADSKGREEKLRASSAELRAGLKRLEWFGYSGMEHFCVVCLGWKPGADETYVGHGDNCWLAALLAKE